MPATFKVDNVGINRDQIDLIKKDAIKPALGKKAGLTHSVEAFNISGLDNMISMANNQHAFVSAVHLAYDKHYKLRLSPDHFWILIMQALTKHINKHAKRLRGVFVSHEGKEYLEVRDDRPIKGSPDNDWSYFLKEISAKIQEKTHGDFAKVATTEFSTTGLVEKMATEVTLMDCMSSYFSYGCLTCCGIPEITLDGTEADWINLAARVDKIAYIDKTDTFFAEWIGTLKVISAKLVDSAKGNPDIFFWRSFFKHIDGGSGGPFVTGWINAFFPYKSGYQTCNRESIKPWEFKTNTAVTDIPTGISSVPFKWKYYHLEYDMYVSAGFIGVTRDPDTGDLSPAVGWMLGEKKQF